MCVWRPPQGGKCNCNNDDIPLMSCTRFAINKNTNKHGITTVKRQVMRSLRPPPPGEPPHTGGRTGSRPVKVTHPPAAPQHPSSLATAAFWEAAARRTARDTSRGSPSGTWTSPWRRVEGQRAGERTRAGMWALIAGRTEGRGGDGRCIHGSTSLWWLRERK